MLRLKNWQGQVRNIILRSFLRTCAERPTFLFSGFDFISRKMEFLKENLNKTNWISHFYIFIYFKIFLFHLNKVPPIYFTRWLPPACPTLEQKQKLIKLFYFSIYFDWHSPTPANLRWLLASWLIYLRFSAL